MSTWERSTRETYAGYATKHIRPLLGNVQAGILAEHRRRREDRCAALGEPPPADAFVFSLAPDNST